jgi:hypothetical protein
MLMDVAVMFPCWSAEPCAVTHRPTARLVESVLAVCEYFVDDEVVTVIEVVFGDEVRLAALRRTPSTVTPLPDTAVTLPEAALKFGKLPPEGREPPLGIDPPFGGVKPAGGPPDAPPPPNPNPPARQLPLESGWLIVTCVAATDDPLGVPIALTQSPTAMFDSDAETV